MSGNINDTDVSQIRKEVYDMIYDIAHNNKNDQGELQAKYEYLYQTSKGLFKFVLTNINADNFKSSTFYGTLELMLNKIEEIQQNKISQLNASGVIGTHLAKSYIPSELLEKKES